MSARGAWSLHSTSAMKILLSRLNTYGIRFDKHEMLINDDKSMGTLASVCAAPKMLAARRGLAMPAE